MLREKALERVLGTVYEYVGHAIIPYEAGGPVHMYCFPQSDCSTAFATMQLLKPDGSGPTKSSIGTSELVLFTRPRVTRPKPNAPFELIENRIRAIFTTIGRYSRVTILNPGDTAEVQSAELHYARANGASSLIRLLKRAGNYPNSDLRRGRVA